MIAMTQRQEHELLEELLCFPTAGKNRSPFIGVEKGLDEGESRDRTGGVVVLCPSPYSVIIISFPVQLCEFPISPETFAVSQWRSIFLGLCSKK